LERKEFWLTLTSPAVLPRLAQLFGRGARVTATYYRGFIVRSLSTGTPYRRSIEAVP
jgi:hypothetical protein